MATNVVETRVNNAGNYRINIMYDDCAECPNHFCEMAAKYIFNCSDRDVLYHECDWEDIVGSERCSLHDAAMALVKKYMGDAYTEEVEEKLECMNTSEIIDFANENIPTLYVEYLKSTGYCQGDVIYGFAYCDEEFFKKEVDENLTSDWKERIENIIQGEWKMFSNWFWGDVYWYSLEKRVHFKKVYDDGTEEDCEEWEEEDSCSGFYGDYEEIIEEYLPEE